MTGRDIKKMLIEADLTQKWLMRQIHRRGYEVDYTRLSHILNDQLTGGSTQQVIAQCNTIINQYNSSFGNAKVW